MDRRVKERLVGATILVVLIVLVVPELLSGPRARVIPAPLPSVAGPSDAVRNVTVDLATSKATPADNTAPSAALVPADSTPAADSAVSGGAAPGNAASGNALPGNEAQGDAAASGEALTAGSSVPNRSPAPPTIATLRAQQPARSAQPALENEPLTPRSPAQVSKPGNANPTASAGASPHHWAVQVGSFASRANAEKLVRQLKRRDASLHVSSSGKGASVRYRVRIGPLADRDAAERLVARLKKDGQPASLVPL